MKFMDRVRGTQVEKDSAAVFWLGQAGFLTEAAILPINGAFGNLNGKEAAEYAGLLKCKICIPCHFWTFPLHHGDPQEIIEHMGESAPDCRLMLLCQGESFLLKK